MVSLTGVDLSSIPDAFDELASSWSQSTPPSTDIGKGCNYGGGGIGGGCDPSNPMVLPPRTADKAQGSTQPIEATLGLRSIASGNCIRAQVLLPTPRTPSRKKLPFGVRSGEGTPVNHAVVLPCILTTTGQDARKRRAQATSSFIPQCRHGISLGGASRGNVASYESYRGQEDSD